MRKFGCRRLSSQLDEALEHRSGFANLFLIVSFVFAVMVARNQSKTPAFGGGHF